MPWGEAEFGEALQASSWPRRLPGIGETPRIGDKTNPFDEARPNGCNGKPLLAIGQALQSRPRRCLRCPGTP